MKIIFREVVRYDEFLSLSIEEVIEIISRNDLVVRTEEKVSNRTFIVVIFDYLN